MDGELDRWSEVDRYIGDTLLGSDAALEAALGANAEGGLPPIDVSAPQGRMLQLFARMVGARRILEIGTLGGYSTICLARALPADGRLTSLELDPRHADVARANIDRAGLAERVEIRVGRAIETLAAMRAAGEGPFDLVFIDADKQSNAAYVEAALGMARRGAAIVVDNVVRAGGIVDRANTDATVEGTRRLYESVGADKRLTATAVQTVGTKGWDGFLLALVD